MRIMIVSTTYYPAMNGQAVFATNLAEGMVKRGHAVTVVIDSPHARASHDVINGVYIDEVPSVSLRFFHAGVYFSPFPGRDMKRLIDRFQPDIVHIQDHYPTSLAAVRIARKRKIKLVGSNHFIPDNIAPYIPLIPHIKPVFNWIMWQWMRFAYRQVDVITAQSVAAAKIIRSQGLTRPIIPISCGIDLQRLFPNSHEDRRQYCQRYGLDPTKKIFLFLGRIDGEKCIDLLLYAMKHLERDDIQLAIAGHGKVEGELRRLSTDLGLEEQVKFTGFISTADVPGLMNSIDVFLMPSEAELLSISTLEAMACGRPVLLANALALPELVKEGLNGYLFRPGDVKDLTRVMNLMADHPERWGEMGAASREVAMHHSLDDTLVKFEALYAKLLSELPISEVTPHLKETA